ncbi:MAG: alanine racemase, partial [Ilumatobacteraceae bacterium]
ELRRHDVCVGSVHELADVPSALRPVVLTPTLAPPPPAPAGHLPAVLTVGGAEHVDALAGWTGAVMVKLRSSMHRYGVAADGLEPLVRRVVAAGLDIAGFALHLPLAGDDAARSREAEHWVDRLDALPDGLGEGELWLSHLAPPAVASLAARHAKRRIRIRVGTMLWHGVPRGEFAHLGAQVLQVQTVQAGGSVGYRDGVAPADGAVVCVGAGSSHGVRPLDHPEPARRSPFHFARRRLALLERPHMHTSLCFVPSGDPCPAVGDMVDVQQPLIDVRCDVIEWRP